MDGSPAPGTASVSCRTARPPWRTCRAEHTAEAGQTFTAEATELAFFSGNPPEGHGGDEAGVDQLAVLQEAVQRTLAAKGEMLTWDGCRLPQARRADVQDLLSSYREAITTPPWWSTIARENDDFARQLVTTDRAPER